MVELQGEHSTSLSRRGVEARRDNSLGRVFRALSEEAERNSGRFSVSEVVFSFDFPELLIMAKDFHRDLPPQLE